MRPPIRVGLFLGFLTQIVVISSEIAFAFEPAMERDVRSMKVHDGWSVSVIASEPDVVDPVAIRFDRLRRMWVVEMLDYPVIKQAGDRPRGRVRVLEDRDGDGHYESAKTFADQLLFPTGVQPWRDGAIVTVAGQIVWLQDQDQDGVAEHSEVWFEGFAMENEQLRANHPTLGPDGMVYVAGGLRGGRIRAVHSRFDTRKKEVDLRGHDFCFDPDGGDWKAVAGNSQYGLSIDDFGRRVGCSNRNPAFTNVLDDDAVARDKLLSPNDAIKDLSKAGDSSYVKPRTSAWTTSNLHSGQFSAACGVAAPGWREPIGNRREWLLVCEPTGNLVQRQWLTSDDGFWRAERDSQSEEFLSSIDEWFRPVDIVAGPEHGIYVADMVRAVIEHPHWAPEELKNRPDTWDGNDRGRVWKIRSAINQLPDPSGIPDVTWLGHSNPWVREVASQYFFESSPKDVSPAMRHVIASSKSAPTAVARAAQWLVANHELDLETSEQLLHAKDPQLLATACRLVELELLLGNIGQSFANHPQAVVRQALASRLGKTPKSHPAIAPLVADVARTGSFESSSVPVLGSVHATHLADLCRLGSKDDGISLPLLSHWWTRWAIEDASTALLETIKNAIDRGDERGVVLMDAWSTGNRFLGKRSMSVDAIREVFGGEGREQVRDIAERVALDRSKSTDTRVSSIRVTLLLGDMPESFWSLLDDDQTHEIRNAGFNGLLKSKPEDACEWLSDQLLTLPPAIRVPSLELICSKRELTLWLLDKIKSGKFEPTILTPQLTSRLTEGKDREIASIANELFAVSLDRQELISRYQRAPQFADGLINENLSEGKRIFLQQCSSCHRIDGVGTNVGPDISDSREKTPESILYSILNPNAAIDAAYFQYRALTADGRMIDGLLIGDRPEGVLLRRQGGEETFVFRSDLERIEASGASLMPNGFERVINEADMANLIAYLKNWRYFEDRK